MIPSFKITELRCVINGIGFLASGLLKKQATAVPLRYYKIAVFSRNIPEMYEFAAVLRNR